jgi:branched-chain amino acid transport system ATP-binding protein
MATFEAHEIVTGYGQTQIVHGVSISAGPGDIISIVGPNGAGKSTFIKALAGSLPVAGGRLMLDGQDVTKTGQDVRARRGVGYVPQMRDVFPSLTVQENLAMGGYLCGKAERNQRRDEVLERFPQLSNVLRSRAGSLSGGERKLLGIGRVLMARPSVLLLDEPSAGLSPRYAEIVRRHVQQLGKDGHSVVLVEQHAVEALEISSQALLLVAGRTRYLGSARELLGTEDLGQMFLGRR